MGKIKTNLLKTILVLGAVMLLPISVNAQSSSTNYKVEESFFGTGGNVDTTSPSYRSRQSLGALGVGSAASNNYDAVAGFNTPNEPFLEVYATGATVSFGTLSDTTPSYGAAQAEACNCTFSVRSYLSSDYAVYTVSQPPRSENNDVLDNKATQGAPSNSTSVEEFGINLVANTSPVLGANPANQPDNSFADGKAATGYHLANQFKYIVGDIIAQSPATAGNPGVGKTDYTISYMAKASSITPAGFYEMLHDIVVVPTF